MLELVKHISKYNYNIKKLSLSIIIHQNQNKWKITIRNQMSMVNTSNVTHYGKNV